MGKNGGFTRKILMWSYERGTLQYDLMCALILAFIFFVPRSCFAPKKSEPQAATSQSVSQNANPHTVRESAPRHGGLKD